MRKPVRPSPATAIAAASTRAPNLANGMLALSPRGKARKRSPPSAFPRKSMAALLVSSRGPAHHLSWARPKPPRRFLALLRQLRKSARTYHERDMPFSVLPAGHFPANLGYEISPEGSRRHGARTHPVGHLGPRRARRRQGRAETDPSPVD